METKTFTWNGWQLTIHRGGILDGKIIAPQIIATKPGNPNIRENTFCKFGEIDFIEHANVQIYHRFRLIDVEGEVQRDEAGLHFNAATQENLVYFYFMINTTFWGKSMLDMAQDGMLIELYDLEFGVIDNDGNFLYPLRADATIDGTTATINILDADPAATEFTYTLNTGLSQSNNVFEDLEPGTYTVVVEAPNCMLCTHQFTISGTEI